MYHDQHMTNVLTTYQVYRKRTIAVCVVLAVIVAVLYISLGDWWKLIDYELAVGILCWTTSQLILHVLMRREFPTCTPDQRIARYNAYMRAGGW